MASKRGLEVLSRLSKDADEAGGGLMGFDIMTIITIVTTLLPLFANCKKKPPVPTPVPEPVAQFGVSSATWRDANDAKWHAEEAYTGRGKFSYRASVVKAAYRKIMTDDPSKTKEEATALALATLERSRTETTSDLALAIHTSKLASI